MNCCKTDESFSTHFSQTVIFDAAEAQNLLPCTDDGRGDGVSGLSQLIFGVYQASHDPFSFSALSGFSSSTITAEASIPISLLR